MPPRPNGQVYVGVIVALGIFTILSQAIITLITSGYDLVSYNRAKNTAQHLATEQIEIIRNLSYADVGTVGGIPAGIFPQTETITRNGLAYTITTEILYIDDPFDSLAPTDTEPNDYKHARVEISWGGTAKSKSPVTMSTNIAPQTLEGSQGGTLSILVSNSLGEPVASAIVTIVADSTSPPVNTTLTTNPNGTIIIPNAPSCVSCYQITATKEGMSTDRTYGTSEVASPIKNHATVEDGSVTEITFAIDATSTLQVSSLNSAANGFTPLGSQTFRLRGNKIIGTDSLGQFVYKFDQEIVTESTGDTTIDNLEWDSYSILNPNPVTRDISATSPLNPIVVNPGEEISAAFATTSTSDHRLLTIFTDNTTTPVSTVSATISDGASFEETYTSGGENQVDYGQAFFENLAEQLYYITATAEGYLDYSGDVFVTDYMTETIQLEKQ